MEELVSKLKVTAELCESTPTFDEQDFDEWESPGERTTLGTTSDVGDEEHENESATSDEVEGGESLSMCESVDGCEMIDGSGDGSFNLGLGGGPKYSELGA